MAFKHGKKQEALAEARFTEEEFLELSGKGKEIIDYIVFSDKDERKVMLDIIKKDDPVVYAIVLEVLWYADRYFKLTAVVGDLADELHKAAYGDQEEEVTD